MKENVFGIDMNVERRTDIENRHITHYAVMRRADMPLHTYPPQIRQRMIPTTCHTCREPCYRDSKNNPGTATIVCLHCVPPVADNYAVQEDVDEIRLMQRERFGL